MKRLCLILALFCVVGVTRADTALVFNEIMYHPRSTDATNEAKHEWVELYNQMAVDLDVSSWRVSGEIDFTFPNGTRIPGKSFVVLSRDAATLMAETGLTNVFGYTGLSITNNRLGNGGGPLKLHNNAGRLMDQVDYGTEADWPVAADGGGVTLAKRDHDFGSANPANWAISAQAGGTPGGDNFNLIANARLIAIDATWKYEDSGTDLGTNWSATAFNDSAWLSRFNLSNSTVASLFSSGVDNNRVVVANNGLDPHYVLTAAAQGTVGAQATVIANNAAWLGNGPDSAWIGVLDGAQNIAVGNYWFRTGFNLDGYILSTVSINYGVAADNTLQDVFLNGVSKGVTFAGFASFSSPFALTGFTTGTNSLEFRMSNDGASANPGGFRVQFASSALSLNQNNPLAAGRSTYYFRKSFTFSGDPQFASLSLNPLLTDGAVFYLNGMEVYRQNMPGGAVTYATAANTNANAGYSGPVTISAASLVPGANVLAVEVHQAAGSPDGPVLGAELFWSELPQPEVNVTFNELAGTTNSPFWLEFRNNGSNSILLDNFLVTYEPPTNAPSIDYVLPAGVTLAPGAAYAWTNVAFSFESGQRLFLYTPAHVRALDGLILKKGPRARYPDGTGEWLVPSAPTPDANNTFAFDNRIVINEIMYDHKAFPQVFTNIPPKDNPEAWIELYNRGTNTVDLSDWQLSGGVSYKFKAGQTLAPGAYLVVADDVDTLKATYPGLLAVGNLGGKLSGNDDRIVLEDPLGNPANQVHYYSAGRWPEYAGGGGSSLELRDPYADNSKPEAWAASDESGKSGWQTYSYRVVAAASSATPQSGQAALDPLWRDFVMGLLSSGECYVDDISVVQSPGPGQIPMVLTNANFENGMTGWRVVGNHRLSRVDVDPVNPANHALHIIASGPQEHMHNHIEATWGNGATIINGQTYEVSFRAKWIAGNNLLNTRGYFNRIARTTPIAYPQLNGTPGARNSRYATNVGPTFAGFQHSPVVPQPGQAATVTVTAQDPQGVASCSVFWSVNGGAWSNAAMTLQNGIYSGTIPGLPATNLVQFYVSAVDGLGTVSTFPANGSNSAAFYRVFDGQANLAALHNIRVLMSPANVSLLHATTNVMSNEVLPATVIYDERIVYYDMAVRLKSSERGRPFSARVGFHLEFHPDELFRGVHPVMLIDRSNGGSRPANEEMLIRHIMLHAGVPAVNPDLIRALTPQVSEYGTAIFAPRFEDEFVGAQYGGAGGGPLHELELIYYPLTADAGGYKIPTSDNIADLDYSNIGGDKEPYRYNFITKNHRDADDYSQFITFAKMFSLTGAQLQLETAQTMDLDEWMSAYGAISLCGIGDMYTFGNNHNFMTYIRSDNQKSVYLPWDMDFSFNNGTGSALVGNRNLANIVNLTPNLRLCYGHILDHIDTTFNTTYMTYWINHYGALAGQNYTSDASYIQARGDFAKTAISAAGGNTAFSVNGTSAITNGSGLVTLTGTAPVWVKTITINGVEYPVTWTSLSAWSITLPVNTFSNNLNIEGWTLNDVLTNTATRLVIYTNAAPDPAGSVVFNEIMYNPSLPDTAYVELFNTSSNASFALGGWRINGLDFTFPPGSFITNGQYAIVAAKAAAYAGAYGIAAGAPIGEFSAGNLQNSGETLTLLRPGATTNDPMIVVDKVRYDSTAPWSTNANGTGSSLQLIDPNQENARVANWYSSFVPAVFSGGISTPSTTNAGWRFVSATGIAGPGIGANQMRLLVNLGNAEINGASVVIDDIVIVTGTNAEVGTSLVRNGDFETGPLLEAPVLTNSWNIGTNYTNTLIVSDPVHAGGGALKVVCQTFGNAQPRLIWQMLSPAPLTNAVHTLSFWFNATNTATNLSVRLQSGLSITTNIQVTITPSNYIPPTLVSAATNWLSPGVANQIMTNLTLPPVWINEVLAENLTGLLDSYGEHEPWIELYNPTTNAVPLAGLYLSASVTNLTHWAFPPGASIGPTQFLVVFCDGQPLQTSNTEYHTSFRLTAASGSVLLSMTNPPLPAVLLNPTNRLPVLDYVNYAGLHSDRSYGSYPDGQPFDRFEFFYVTPGGTNDGRSAPLQVFINEWMASNIGPFADPADGDFDDWFELFNPGSNTVDLAGYYLTDTLSDKTKYLITTNGPHTIGPGGFLLVWADNETGQNTSAGVPRADLHVNFQLAKAGEAIGLFAADGTQIDAINFVNAQDNVSSGRYPDGSASGSPGFYAMTNPTPRLPNHLAQVQNTPPVLDPIGNKALYLGQTLNFTATASDADVPGQILGFTLDVGAPPGAGINLNSGAFTWTPSSVGAYPLTVRVTDNGSPTASDLETITVTVLAAPGFSHSARNGNDFELTWGTYPGKKYAVEYKDDLNTPGWTPLQTNTATGTTLSYTNTTGGPQRFYHLRVVE